MCFSDLSSSITTADLRVHLLHLPRPPARPGPQSGGCADGGGATATAAATRGRHRAPTAAPSPSPPYTVVAVRHRRRNPAQSHVKNHNSPGGGFSI